MGNFFIGFPVPRARIAEMIEGFAPPLAHIANHIPGGSDPFVASMTDEQILIWDAVAGAFKAGSAGGGGLASLYAETGLFYHTFFSCLDNFYQAVTGDGTIAAGQTQVSVSTGTTQNGSADFRRTPENTIVTKIWGKTRKFKCKANIVSASTNEGEAWIITGRNGVDNDHIGFVVVDGVLYGSYCNYPNQDTVEIETLGAGAYNETRVLECVWTPGGNIVFTVDGTDYTITSPTISGSDNADRILAVYVKNPDAAGLQAVSLSEYKFYQAA